MTIFGGPLLGSGLDHLTGGLFDQLGQQLGHIPGQTPGINPAAPPVPIAPQPSINDRLMGALNSPLLQLGLGLLEQSGPSLTPVSTGQALARAAQGTIGQQQSSALLDARRQLLEAQAQEALGGGPGATNVARTFEGGNGNMWIIRRDGSAEDLGVPFDQNTIVVEREDGGKELRLRSDGSLIRVLETGAEAQAGAEALEGAKETGTQEAQIAAIQPRAEAESRAEAQKNLQANIDRTDSALKTLEEMKTHPGLSGAVGAKSAAQAFGALETPIGGTEEASFVALVDKVGGEAFLRAFQDLKGGGHITEIEGQKAEQAITTLRNRDQTESQYRRAIDDLVDIMNKGLANQKSKAGVRDIDAARRQAINEL